MNIKSYLIKKVFPDIGEVEYKVASSRQELEKALALIYKEFLVRGYILPKYYKSGLRITLHNVVPGTATFIALKDKEVIGAVTLFPDSPLGLPMDVKYKEATDKLRKEARKICEVGQLSIKSGLFGSGLFSMFNFKKLNFIFHLFKMVFHYAYYEQKFDDICIVVSPKTLLFKFLIFENMGEIKYYGFDRISIKPKPAVAKRLDLRNVEERAKIRIGLYKIFFGERLPKKLYNHKFCFGLEDLKYFFVKKSDIFKQASQEEKRCIADFYGLKADEMKKITAG